MPCQPLVNSIVQLELDVFHKINRERPHLHLKAEASDLNTATLRSRIWFLEDANEALRADITDHAYEQERMSSENTALLAEKEALVGERDWTAGDRDRAVQENDALRVDVELLKSSKEGLVADLEDLEAENEDLIAGKEALLVRLLT